MIMILMVVVSNLRGPGTWNILTYFHNDVSVVKPPLTASTMVRPVISLHHELQVNLS